MAQSMSLHNCLSICLCLSMSVNVCQCLSMSVNMSISRTLISKRDLSHLIRSYGYYPRFIYGYPRFIYGYYSHIYEYDSSPLNLRFIIDVVVIVLLREYAVEYRSWFAIHKYGYIQVWPTRRYFSLDYINKPGLSFI